MPEVLLSIFHEYGPTVGGYLVSMVVAGLVIKWQANKLEAAHEKSEAALVTSHEQHVKAINEGHAREVEAIKADRDRGWSQAGVWQTQAERLAERYGEATALSADLANEVLPSRRRRAGQ